jgi:hypothetical protein
MQDCNKNHAPLQEVRDLIDGPHTVKLYIIFVGLQIRAPNR